jgi:hypothetical protein
VFLRAVAEDMFEQIVILIHGVTSLTQGDGEF